MLEPGQAGSYQRHATAVCMHRSFSDEAGQKPAAVPVGFHGERYIFVQVHSARGPAGGPVGDHVHDAFARVRIGLHEARTATVENSRAPKFNSVCCFPSTMFDPATDRVHVSVYNEDFNGGDTLLGHRVVPLQGIRAAPPLVGNTGAWKAPAAWYKLSMQNAGGGGQVEVSISMWTANAGHPAFTKSAVAQMRAPQQRLGAGLSSRVRLFEEPRMTYLFLEVRKAHGLQARSAKVTGMSDPYVHITVGQQQARTHIAAVRAPPCPHASALPWPDGASACESALRQASAWWHRTSIAPSRAAREERVAREDIIGG